MVIAIILAVLCLIVLFFSLVGMLLTKEIPSILSMISPALLSSLMIFYAVYANKVSNENNAQQ